MKFYNSKKVISIVLTGFILINLTGCKSNKVESELESINKGDNTTVSLINDNEQLNQDYPNEEESDMVLLSKKSKDEIIINYFDAAVSDITDFLNSNDVKKAKQKCKEYFITFVDFIFYDGTIKDIKFSDLKEETKTSVMKIVNSVDNLIMKKYPDYKDDVTDKSKEIYNKASEKIDYGKSKAEDYIITKIGKEKYQEIVDSAKEISEKDKDTWNNVKEKSTDLYNEGKNKVKTWYKNFKNK